MLAVFSFKLENWCQKESKKRSKSEPKTIQDHIFEIFGRFGRRRNSDVFSKKKKVDRKSKKNATLDAKSKVYRKVGGGGGAR